MRAQRSGRSRRKPFLRDRRGAAAVEFAVILPVMLLFYLGIFEASNAIIVKRKIDTAAETVGGLVARSSQMSATRLKNIQLISDAIVGNADGTPPEITVTTVTTDASGKSLVDWERKGEAQGAAKGTAYSLPSDLADLKDAYFVFAKVSYRYVPTFDFAGLFGAIRFERTFAFQPRKGDRIKWE